jgi:hypothetical protein
MEVVVSFAFKLLCPWRKSIQYPLDRRVAGPQSNSECDCKEKETLPMLEIKAILWPFSLIMYLT